jgi:hypothetical protein
MVTHAVAFAMDAIKQLNEFDRFDGQAGLFAYLADYTGGERFTDFEQSSGKRPVAFEGLAAATHQQDAAPVDDDRAYADQGCQRKLTLHSASAGTSLFLP